MTGRARHPGSVRRGAFTLVETLGVIAVLGVLGSLVATLLATSAVAYRDATAQTQLHGEASVTLDRLVRELREIERDDAAPTLAPDIAAATTTSLDWSAANAVAFAGGALTLCADGVNTDVLATDVATFALDYFDEDNQSLLAGAAVPPADIANIRRISATLTLSRQGHTETLRTKVFLRSMMADNGP